MAEYELLYLGLLFVANTAIGVMAWQAVDAVARPGDSSFWVMESSPRWPLTILMLNLWPVGLLLLAIDYFRRPHA